MTKERDYLLVENEKLRRMNEQLTASEKTLQQQLNNLNERGKCQLLAEISVDACFLSCLSCDYCVACFTQG